MTPTTTALTPYPCWFDPPGPDVAVAIQEIACAVLAASGGPLALLASEAMAGWLVPDE